MNPGLFRERLTIQSESRTPDTVGGAALAWNEVAIVWGRVRPLEGTEAVRAEELAATVTHEVTIRFRDGLTAANRLLWRGTPLQIRVVTADAWRRFLTLLCEEGENT